jgi:RNA polymerase sigma factor (sigma-70 family)
MHNMEIAPAPRSAVACLDQGVAATIALVIPAPQSAIEFLIAPDWSRPLEVWLRGRALHNNEFENRDGLEDAKGQFARLILPYLPDAYALARSLTGNRTDAEDVVQESCLRAFRALGSVTITNARAWLLTIVHNTTYTWLAKNRSAVIVTVDDLEDAERAQTNSSRPDDQTPEAAIIAQTDGECLRAAIQELSTPLRETLVLRDVQGLSYRDIAEVTGVPIGTVMSRLARARARLIAVIGKAKS